MAYLKVLELALHYAVLTMHRMSPSIGCSAVSYQSGALQSRPPCVMCPSAHLMQLLPQALAVSSLLSSHTSVPLANALW